VPSARRRGMQKDLRLFLPLTPMRRVHVNALYRFRIEPTAEEAAAAGKFQRVYFAGRIKNGEFKVVVKRRGRDGLPIHNELSNAARCPDIDLDQWVPRVGL
jgi:hypothetical protein